MLSSNDGFLMLAAAAPASSRLLLVSVSSLSTRCRSVLSDDRVFGCDNARLLCVTTLRVVVDGTDEELGRFAVDTSSSVRVRRRPLVRRLDLGRVLALATGTAAESSIALDLRLIPEYVLSFGVDDPILL